MEGREVSKRGVWSNDDIVGLVLVGVQVETDEWTGVWVVGLAGVVKEL